MEMAAYATRNAATIPASVPSSETAPAGDGADGGDTHVRERLFHAPPPALLLGQPRCGFARVAQLRASGADDEERDQGDVHRRTGADHDDGSQDPAHERSG